ncbi:MAG: hypothetical protein IJK06_02370 [Clostridia bacterium]|nr:hypothetical protein [Clostridia bacterium]
MKKLSSVLSAILCALLIACLAVSACAEEVPTSNVYRPKISETFKAITAGKTFEAQVSRNEVYGQDEDARWTINITACEETHFKAEDIENLKANDIIAFNPGEAIFIVEKTAEEDGFRLVDSNSVVYYFTKAEDGDYIGRTENDNMFFTAIFTITIPLEKDISFLDWSDPENLEAPVKKGYDELLDLLLEDTNFAPYNTKVTFDENGMLTELLYTYSPWN